MRTIQLPIRISITILTLAVLLSQFTFAPAANCSASTCTAKKCPCGCCEQIDTPSHSCCQHQQHDRTVTESEEGSLTFQSPKSCCHCQDQPQPPALPAERSLPFRLMSELFTLCHIDTSFADIAAHPSMNHESAANARPSHPSLSILFCTWRN